VLPADHRFAVGLDIKEVWLDVPGARLHALHLQQPNPRGLVFFLHGNGGSLQDWFVNLDFYRRAKFDLYMLDYRGYGKSSGRIESEAQLHADVMAAWNSVAPRYAGLRRVVFGRSLGTGLAVHLGGQVQPELTLLVSPYVSMEALAAEHYPWVPRRVLRYPLRTDLSLPLLKGAVMLVHGSDDTLIDPSHSQRLMAVKPSSSITIIQGAGHNDLQRWPAYGQALAAALSP
jgi:pimeloyl-ACP methyl ester carboxylesterase